MSEKEGWASISGWVGLYDVSSLGRVRSIGRRIPTKGGSKRWLAGRILKPYVGKRKGLEYAMIGLRRNGKRVHAKVHTLVLRAFIPNPLNKPECNHENGDKTDNRVRNLSWATKKENILHSRRSLKQCIGSANGTAKLSESDIPQIFRVYHGTTMSQADVGGIFGVSQATVGSILRRETWRHVKAA